VHLSIPQPLFDPSLFHARNSTDSRPKWQYIVLFFLDLQAQKACRVCCAYRKKTLGMKGKSEIRFTEIRNARLEVSLDKAGIDLVLDKKVV